MSWQAASRYPGFLQAITEDDKFPRVIPDPARLTGPG